MQDAVTAEPRISPWHVRDATYGDLAEIAGALGDLLAELGGTPPAARELERAAAETIADPASGCLLVAATAADGLVGVLAASWQHAVHVPGRYCILQDLWTEPAWRGEGVGAALVAALAELMRRQGMDRVEVGLPSRAFAGLEATEAFYRANGFVSVGPRMRQVLR